MLLFKKAKKNWSVAYYQENNQSPFKFEWITTNDEDIENPFDNMDERKQRCTIYTFSDIDFSKDNKVFIDNHGYLIEVVEPNILKEYLNSPFFKTKPLGKKLVLVY